jgi:PAS domain S-box-containing protein
LIDSASRTDTLNLAAIVTLAGAALSSFALNGYVESEWSGFRLLVALLIAAGLLMRGHPRGRWLALTCGVLAMIACGVQLASVLEQGPAQPELSLFGTHSFSLGMLCVGLALMLDSVLPARWGRHLLFGLLGAIAAMIGAAGLFVSLTGLAPVDDGVLRASTRTVGSTIILLAGLSLLIGARLRSSASMDQHTVPYAREELRDRSGLATALIVLFVTLGATLLIWRQVHEQNLDQFETRQSDDLHRFSGTLAFNAQNIVVLLNGVRGLFAASDRVDGEEWKRFFEQLSWSENYTGIVVIAYAARIQEAQSDADGQRFVMVGDKRLDVWPTTTHTPLYPTIYMMPDNVATRSALGLDIGADPALAEALERARDMDRIAVSGRMEFGRYRDPKSRRGFTAVLALAEHEDGGDAQRADGIGVTGFVYCAMDIDALVRKSADESRTRDLAVRIVDDAQPGDGIPLFQSADFDATRASVSSRMSFGGRHWTLSAQLLPETAVTTGLRNPGSVLAGGLIAAILLFSVTWVLAGHRARAMHLARQINRELVQSQKAQQAVTDTANAGIITADYAGNILYMNPAAALEFGVDAQAMVGESLTRLMPERFRDAHTAGIQRMAGGGERRVIGQALELAGLRANGSEFPIEVLLSAWTSEGRMYFTAFISDITERKAAQTELARRALELERSNADLEQFAYVASHDLQEPLRMVASYVQLLARRYRGQLDADADEFIGFAVDGATRMQRLIEDLLAFARVGRSGVVPTPTDVAACAAAAVAHLQETIRECGASLRIDLDCRVMAVPAQLTQVFQNLLANAMKFRAEAAPEIVIDARREGDAWHVRVADNGIGIAEKHHERVFAIFQRLHTRCEYSGTGIGLAICRRIIDGFGGSIWVESEPDKGSVFHFLLPQAGVEE